jgi:uncharacterized membrane protein (DUF2068 family)
MEKVLEMREVPAEGKPSVSEGAHEHAAHPKSERGLLLIGLFKLSKSLSCLVIGAMCLHLIHRDLGDMAMRVVDWLGLDPTGRVAAMFLEKADLISGHQLRVTGYLSFVGGILYAIEGTGLMLHKVWAEYFTVCLTTLGLPWEIYEMGKHFTAWKLALFVANVVVLAYLIWLIRRKREREGRA